MDIVNGHSVALYIRVSTEEQVEGYSLEAQQEALLRHCQLMNYTVYRIYTDAGRSGKSIMGRPAFQELLRDLPAGYYSKVLCLRINRIARNQADLLYALQQFNQHGVSFHSITENLPTDSTLSTFLVQMIGAVAQLEREQMVQNTKLGMQARSKQGQWNSGNQVLGYRWIIHPTQRKLSHLEIVPEEAALVRVIFERYAQGQGYRAISNWLNQEGYLTKRGKAFTSIGVKNILSNPNYIGKITYSADNSKQVVDGTHEAIIGDTLWHTVQELLQVRAQNVKKTNDHDSFLSGLLKCPSCGHSMIPAHVNRKPKHLPARITYYYVCSRNRSSGSAICLPHYIPALDIELWVTTQLQLVLTQPEVFALLIKEMNQRHDKKMAPLQEQIKQAEKHLQRLKTRRNRCFELYEDGHYNEQEIQERLASIRIEQAQHETTITTLQQQLQEHTKRYISTEKVHSALRDINALFREATPDQRHRLYHSMIDKIVLPPDRAINKSVIYTKSSLFHLPIRENKKGAYKQ